MPKPSQTVEVNNFITGLITEASPTSFPPTASKDEANFILNRDGTRNRRFGVDYESLGSQVATGINESVFSQGAVNTFLWENVAENPDLNFSAIQVCNKVFFFDTTVNAPSTNGLKGSIVISGSDGTSSFSFTAVDGILVIATGEKDFTTVSYTEATNTFTQTQQRILVRDLWGLEDPLDGKDISVGGNTIIEPAFLTNAHLYNLRNQSWGFPRRLASTNAFGDPITEWRDKNPSTYPANIHSIWTGMEFDPAHTFPTEEFSADLLRQSTEGQIPTAKGHFIIDLLDRGDSRVAAEQALRDEYSTLSFTVNAASIKEDSTPGGATTVIEFAGRVFYGGFSGTITDGDTHSPRLQSYICFSRLVDSPTDINQCYSSGDPTSRSESDLIDTDGGFIRISGARKILKLANLGSSLFVIADNGIWMVRGGSGFGFNATNFEVVKITDYGAINAKSVVEVGTTLYYWAEDGIYTIATDQFGDYKATNITESTIQTFYNEIGASEQIEAQGIYDKFNRSIRWVYNMPTSTPTKEVKEIVLDLDLQAWIPTVIKNLDSNTPLIRSIFETPPISVVNTIDNVVVNDVQVVVNGDNVFVEQVTSSSTIRTLKYLAFDISNASDVTFSFAEQKDTTFRDWKSVDDTGADAEAFLQTGDETVGTTALDKQVPYLFMHFRRTEDGFINDGSGDLTPTNQSGCKVQVRWDFSNSNTSNRWGREFQAYRYPRPFFASGLADEFDTGFELISTKNKIRGRGKSFSMRIRSEPDKDCQLVGWGLAINGNRVA